MLSDEASEALELSDTLDASETLELSDALEDSDALEALELSDEFPPHAAREAVMAPISASAKIFFFIKYSLILPVSGGLS